MENSKIPYGVLVASLSDVSTVSPKYSDGYFDKEWIECIKHFSDQLGKEYTLRIAECENIIDLAKFMGILKKKYSNETKANFGIFSGHGNANQFFLGSQEKQINYLERKDLSDTRLQKYRHIFSPRATLIIDACETGKDWGFAEDLSIFFNVQVMAPMSKTSLKEVNVIHKRPEHIILDANYHFGAMTKISGG